MTITTAMTRCSPIRRRSATTGLSKNVKSSASAIGMKTTRAQYRHAIARMRPPRTTGRDAPIVSCGLSALTRGRLLRPDRQVVDDTGDVLDTARDLLSAHPHFGIIDGAGQIDRPAIRVHADLRQRRDLLLGELGLDRARDRRVVDILT